jgi:hypothetical protein
MSFIRSLALIIAAVAVSTQVVACTGAKESGAAE